MRKFFDYLIAIFVTGCSLFYIPGQTFGDAQIDFFKIGVCALFVISLFFKPKRSLINPYLNAYLGLALLILFLVPENVKTIMIAPFVNLFLAVLLFYIITNYLEDRTLIYKGIAAVIGINCIMVALQVAGLDPICLNDTGHQNFHWVGLFGYKMNLGAYAALAVPIFMSLGLWIIAAGSIILCIASKSWGAWLAMTIGILFFAKRTHMRTFKILMIATILIVMIGGIIVTKVPIGTIKSKFTIRYELQKPMLAIAMRSPYVGYGMGSAPYILQQESLRIAKETGSNFGVSDEIWNDYLELVINLGFGALIILLLLVRRTWRQLQKAWGQSYDLELMALAASLLTIAVGMGLHSYINFPNIGVISLVVLALFEIKIKEVVSED
jgi:hypothetical protein